MSALNSLVKSMLLTYPTLYKSRVCVLKQLFTSTSWNSDGSIWHPSGKRESKMVYRDLDYDSEFIEQHNQISLTTNLYNARKFQNEKERLIRKHIEDNIDLVSSNIHAHFHEPHSYHLGYYMENLNEYSPLKNIPSNVSEETSEAIHEFIDFWIKCLFAQNNGFTTKHNKLITNVSDCYTEKMKEHFLLFVQLKEIKNDLYFKRRATLEAEKNLKKLLTTQDTNVE